MSRPTTNGRPDAVHLDVLRARAKKGPREDRWYWHIERKVEGRWVSSGAGIWANRRELDRAMARLLSAPAATTTMRARVETVRELLGTWRAWFETESGAAVSTIESMQYVLIRITRQIGDVSLEALPVGALEDYAKRRLREHTPTSTIRLELRYMKMAWIWGMQRRLVSVPLTLPHVPSESKRKKGESRARRKHTPTVGDVAAVIRAIESKHPEHAAALHLQLATGARVAEVASVQWDALKDGWIELTGKTGTRRVPLAPEAYARLQALEPDEEKRTGRVFLATTYNALRCGLRHYCERAEVPAFTSHGIRRLVVDEMRRAGVDVKVAASITGHHPAVMLTYYAGETTDEQASAVDMARLGRLPSGKVLELKKRE